MPARMRNATLGFVGGYVDAFGFVALYGLFTSHVTGNFVLLGAAAQLGAHGAMARIVALPVFALAVIAAKLMEVALRRRGIAPLRWLLLLEALLLTGFLLAGMAAEPFGSADAPQTILVGMVGVMAMAVQNAMGRLALPTEPPTSVMTSNWTSLMIEVTTAWVEGGSKAAGAARRKAGGLAPVVAAFALGTAAGGIGFWQFGFAALALPVTSVARLGLMSAPAGTPP